MKHFLMAALAAAILVPLPAMATVKVNWSTDKDNGLQVLYGQPDEEETDQVLSATCRKDGRIDLHLGAYDDVGEGKGEAVSVTLSSGGKSAVLNGKSQNSENFEMTGGTELFTTVGRDDALFAVLATGKPITATGVGSPKKPDTWGATGLQKSAAAFLAACSAKK
ncbi:MAG TPA: hypothetical protein VH000_05935 [Rhizomicrobium sp.]|jgi:hypothetical protein|nr:hypothetical protein [Rhizomicrobium sp.]